MAISTTLHNTIRNAIQEMNRSELDAIQSYMNSRRDRLNAEITGRLNVGDAVIFSPRRRIHRGRALPREINGTVTAMNRKTISVDCGVHGRWRIAPQFLKLASTSKFKSDSEAEDADA